MDLQKLETEYNDSLIEYQMAQRIVLTTLENLRDLLEIRHRRTIFYNIKHRLKEFDSAKEKCERKNYNNTPEGQTPEFDIKTIHERMLDIAGVRVVTVYPDDVYLVAEAIKNELVIAHEDDYIKTPKESGYSSLHLIASVQVTSINGNKKNVPVEIQLRNMIMDAWATMDHGSRYKKDSPNQDVNMFFQNLAISFKETNEGIEKYIQKPAD